MERKLAAIFSADVAGYSRLMGDDEEATIRTLTASREIISSLIQQYRGRVIDSPGDNLLAEFASVVDAVRSAIEIQHELKIKNAELPDHRRMQFRIGINLGDVIVEGERLYGDGVNIAARLESLAIPGGICISGTVYDQIETKLSLQYEYQGEQTVKNIAKPVRVYRVAVTVPSPLVGEGQGEGAVGEVEIQKSKGEGQKSKIEGRAGFARQKWMMSAVVGLLLIAAAIVAVRYLSFPLLGTRHSVLGTEEAKPPLLPLPDKPSIVVLPFVNMSKDPDQEYFSDGLTETLTGALSKISSLFIISRNSAFTYKGKAVKVQDVGREMGVRYVLEGSIQKADQQVRITVQLIEAATGYHLWSEQYDRPLKDIFALQDEIVQKIVTTLRLQLTLQEQGYIVRKHTDNLEAYDAFLRGMEYLWRSTKETSVQARQMFEKAIELDPQYAEAYTWLGWTYWAEWVNSWSVDPQTLERALELAQQALTLDDSLPVAHSRLAMVYAMQQQYEQAIAEGERAIALDFNDADGYWILAEVLRFAGRPEEAVRRVEQAMRLNPRYPPVYLFTLGESYFWTGRYPEAITALKEAASRSPNFVYTHFFLALGHVEQWGSQQSPDAQTVAQALAAVQRAIALSDSFSLGHALLGYIYLLQQQYEQANAEMEQTIALVANEAFSFSSAILAETLSRVGRSEDAVAMAEQALRRKPHVVDEHLSSVGAAYYLAGRPEEAIAPLRQYLSHYPNILSAHLILAAVYSEVGKEAEARTEAAEVLRLNPKFSLEVHKERAPIKDPALLERHLAALRKAGLK
jgi:adenylate cyclase